MRGHEVNFICADDAHGTPIMLKAQQLGITPEQMIGEMSQEHQTDFAGFNISYDNYHSTHSEENRQLSELIYSRLKENGFIKNRTISQLYDPEKGMFLPDRFVKGTCPKCKSPDQYGDNCEVCGATYSPTELIEPKSVVSGATPVMRDSEHFFFDLPSFSEMLQAWTRSGALQEQVANKMQEWFESGLQQWDISRDAPYFGFEIPNAPGKYFYVWLDAPIGYMGSFKNLCDKRGDSVSFDEYWKKDSTAELYHFIGKDIVYFHSLFWPAMLEGSNFRKPTNLFVHGYVTVNGAKMSKSRGTFIKASLKNTRQHLMTGVSHMIPFVVSGGILLAVSVMLYGKGAVPDAVADPNLKKLFDIGVAGLTLMVPFLVNEFNPYQYNGYGFYILRKGQL